MDRQRASSNASTPEELGTLLEDALITRDREALATLFEASAVLIAGSAPARGRDEIARVALATWQGEQAYVSEPSLVVQARDLALVVEKGGMQVARRIDGAWRYAIVLHAEDFPRGAEHDVDEFDPGSDTKAGIRRHG